MPVERGFTLLELVIGTIVFSIVMLIVITLVAPQTRNSVDPIWQVRATELGQSLLNEITAKPFDQQSNASGGSIRCNETALSAPNCTASGALGSDGSETRDTYNDVDDYHGLDLSDANISNSLGESLAVYQGFRAQVAVYYDDNFDGIDDSGGSTVYVGNHKRITVVVTTPGGEQIGFAAYRSNY